MTSGYSRQKLASTAADERLEFRARRSVAGVATNTALVLLVGCPAVYLLSQKPPVQVGPALTIVVLLAFAIASLFFLAILPTMQYVVDSRAVHLFCGPFHWTIPVDQIEAIVEKDLDYMPLSEGWKLPGYTLFSMRFADVGKVRMCATSMTKRILLVQTKTDQWGIFHETLQDL